MSLPKMDDKLKQYRAYVADTSDFNRKLVLDRRSRLPYVDQQTSIAQSDSLLWRNEQERTQFQPDLGCQAKIFRYPPIRWQKRDRHHLNNYEYPSIGANHQREELQKPPVGQTTHISSTTSTASTLSVPAGNHLDLIDQMDTTDLIPFNNGANKRSSHCQSQIDGSFNLSQPLQPPRSSSVGSYSCIDSDSRDQSSATSQYVDSPRRAEEDQIYRNNHHHSIHNGITPEHSSGLDSGCCKDANGEKELEDEPSSSRGSDTPKNNPSVADGESTDEEEVTAGDKSKQVNGFIESSLKHRGRKSRRKLNNQLNEQPIASQVNSDRPYVCETCDHTYKTRPGLSYHFIHIHNAVLPKKLMDRRQDPVEPPPADVQQTEQKVKKTSRKKVIDRQSTRASRRIRGAKVEEVDPIDSSKRNYVNQREVEDSDMDCSENNSDKIQEVVSRPKIESLPDEPEQPGVAVETGDEESRAESDKTVIEAELEKVDQAISSNPQETLISTPVPDDPSNGRLDSDESLAGAKQNIFCDFCLGTAERNRRTRLPEELISCSSCGSSGHPSCLQFSEENLVSVKKYKWQCIDCKTCTVCDAADNEAQLLICNDCDRSYHTYCLRPPLNELPEENWSCSICMAASEGK